MTSTRGLQLDEDLEFQRREWRFQRAGWWGLSAFVLAAVLGAFGGGPLSAATATSAEGALRIEYERFVRVGTRTRLAIHAQMPSRQPNGLELTIDRSYFEAMRIERIAPEPVDLAIESSTVTLRFEPTARENVSVFVDLQPAGVGRHPTTVRVSGAGSVAIRQFAYF